MSRPIDEKIVSLKLDDEKFKKNASESLSIFGKLQDTFSKSKQVNLSKSVESLKDVGRAADNVSLGKLGTAIEGIGGRFNAMSAIAFSVLNNITNRAVNAGMSIAKSFTLDPVMDGFREYELKIGSIQTILANTQGKNSLKQVTDTLDELNTYADKTIYNFGEMTRNIGTFTAAGVDLDTAAISIQGIANLAATSGSNSQQASTAMYQLSQAISSGSVKLQDWNSVVNAGMGGKLFQEALMKTADSMGIAHTGAENFRESLQEGWITSEVLTKTLARFAEDESMLDAATKVRTFTQLVDTAKEAVGSGWAQTWELVFGDFEEATELWSSISDWISKTVDALSDARNGLIKSFVDMGGRQRIIDSLLNTFKALGNILGPVAKALRNFIPPITADKLMKFADGLHGVSESFLEISGPIGEKAGDILTTILNAIREGAIFVWDLGKAFLNLLPRNLTSSIKSTFKSIFDGIDKSNFTIGDFVKSVSGMFFTMRDAIFKAFSSLDNFIETIFSNSEKSGSAFRDFITEAFTHIGNALKTVWKYVSMVDFESLFSAGFLVTLFNVSKKFSGLTDSIGDFLSNILSMKEERSNPFAIFETLGESLKDLTTSFKIASLLSIAGAIGILALSLKILEGMDSADIAEGLMALGTSLAGLLASLKVIGGLNLGLINSLSAIAIIGALATAILILSGALKVIETIDSDAMGKTMMGLVGIITSLVGGLKVMSMGGGVDIATSATTLVGLAIAIRIMAGAVKTLSELDSVGLQNGVTALGVIFLELGIFMKIVNGSKLSVLSAAGLVITAGAVKVMVGAISELGDMNTNTIIKGVSAIGGLLLELAIFSRLARGGQMILAGAGLTIIAKALESLVGPITTLGKTKLSTLATGIGAIAVTLAAIGLSMKVVNPFSLLIGAAAMKVMAEALDMMVTPIRRLGNMSLDTLAIGIGAVVASLLSMALISRVAGVSGSVGLMGMALAVKMLVPSLEALGQLSLSQIAIGLGALAATFAVIGGAAILLSGATLALLGFAASMLAIGAGVALLGAGLTAFGTGLAILGGLTVATAKGIIATLETLLKGLGGLIPLAVGVVVKMVVEMLETIAVYMPRFIAAGVSILLSILDGIGQNIYEIGESATLIITEMANALGENAPKLLDAGVELAVDLTNGLANSLETNSPKVVAAILNLAGSVLIVLSEALEEAAVLLFGWIPGFEEIARELGSTARDGIRQTFRPYKVADDGSKEFIDGVNRNRGGFNEAGKSASKSTLSGMNSVTGFKLSGESHSNTYNRGVQSRRGASDTAGRMLSASTNAGIRSVSMNAAGVSRGNQHAQGVNSTKAASRNSGINIASAGRSGAGSVSFRSSGANAGYGFAGGLSSTIDYVRNTASGLAAAASSAIKGKLRIKSPSRVTRQMGNFTGEGLGLGIQDMTRFVVAKSKTLASKAAETMSEYAQAINDSLNTDIEYNPRIAPILDMSNMKLSDLDIYRNGKYEIDTSGVGERSDRMLAKGQSSGTETNYYYDLKIEANGELPPTTIKKMASTFMREVKNGNDRAKINRGEFATY